MCHSDIKCVSGCECTTSVVDAIWEFKHSQLGSVQFTTTQHKECTIKITVLEESSSKGYKVIALQIWI